MVHQSSDKVYWHKYLDFYERFLPKRLNCIVEIGVFQGDSIRYWREKYPSSHIYGLDIVDFNPSWPTDPNIAYFQLDQSNISRYREVMGSIGKKVDLLIEDGSHDPLHQKISLMESINFLNEGSIYILEDLHTSLQIHPYYQKRLKEYNNTLGFFKKKSQSMLMSLQGLLLIDHYKTNEIDLKTNKPNVDYSQSLFSYEELEILYQKVKKIHFYRRSVLPNYCFACKTNDFDFVSLKCACGVDLYSGVDSMSAILEF